MKKKYDFSDKYLALFLRKFVFTEYYSTNFYLKLIILLVTIKTSTTQLFLCNSYIKYNKIVQILSVNKKAWHIKIGMIT